ncbi:MAG: hypothetical protein MUC84_10380 [Solirubrobacteraceae bacterium]|nr:hypothetical protein [Solirubrobacteraceae bacterium]
MGRRAVATALGCTLALALPIAPAAAKTIVTRSPDSLAPASAPAHWLPPEPWVYNHWLPYDETRLYRLLGITRSELWLQLRDDRRTLAQLAARRGWRDPGRLADALVAPRRARLGPARTGALRDRALRTITQGHLAQHVFFHSLHQFALPSAAPDIFGVTDAAFRGLRKQELSPLEIGRLLGRSPGAVQALSIEVLRERVAAGVAGGAMPAAQGRLLLRRQLSQLPRWLDQARYNGPPLTRRGALTALPQDYASNPAISANGRFLAYEAYRQKLKAAITLGEIAVLRADLEAGRSTLVSPVLPADANGARPRSAYNAAISGDGSSVTYESSEGNQNFAKRYGRIGVLLCDLRGAKDAHPVAEYDPRAPDSQSAYNPALAADGSRVVYTAVRGGRTSVLARAPAGGPEQVVVAGAVAGGPRFADPYEPGVSADGARVVYTLARGPAGRPERAGSAVFVRDLRARVTLLASRADGPAGAPATGFSADAALSHDGRWAAFTSTGLGGGPGLFLRDLDGGRTLRIPAGPGLVLDPVVADGGAVVAFTRVRGRQAQVWSWRRATGALSLVSRASGPNGLPGNDRSEDPSIDAAGTRVAFVSRATNLDPRSGGTPRAIFVRDLVRNTTRRVSDPSAAYPGTTP